MNGIIGIKSFTNIPKKSSQNQVERLVRTKKSKNSIVKSRLIVGYNRLPITDQNPLSNQPFEDESGRYILVLNGSIYNFYELKNELLQLGILFNTRSDTEVLLHFLIQFGTSRLADINGDFAFAFYDSVEDELILARDGVGVKSIYFSIEENQLIFGSNLMDFRHFISSWKINQQALNAYFQFTYIPAPLTIINEISELLPGYYLHLKGRNADMVPFYQIELQEPTKLSFQEAQEKLKQLVKDAVANRYPSETEAGSFLSGGVDSSIVSLLATEIQPDIKTFSIGFQEEQFFDETKYAETVSKHIDSWHFSLQLGENQIKQKMSTILSKIDEPFADSSAVAVYFLTRKAKEKVQICFSGDGADELFGGYHKHYAFLKAKGGKGLLKYVGKLSHFLPKGNRGGKLSNRVRQMKKYGRLLQTKWPESYWLLATFIGKEKRTSLLKEPMDFQSKLSLEKENLNHFLLADQHFILPNDMLKKVGMMSRVNQLEIRTPFLDRSIVEFANQLPEEYKRQGKNGKRILKEIFKNDLPQEVFQRKKRGFEIPLQQWIETTWDEIVDVKWWDKTYLEEQNIFNLDGVQQLKSDFINHKTSEETTTMWAYIVFQNWYQRWVEK